MVSVQRALFPSLDYPTQISTWSLKGKRVFSCALAGMTRALAFGKKCYFLTLTSAVGMGGFLARDWDLLVKRIRRELHFDFQYVKVETSEGNGVIHALYHSAFDGWCYDAIHAYLSCLWMELHNSPVVWNSVVGETKVFSRRYGKWILLTKERVARYIVQYASNQRGFLRKANSFGWIFRGWRKLFVGLIRRNGFELGLVAWRNVLMSDFDLVKTFDMVIGV